MKKFLIFLALIALVASVSAQYSDVIVKKGSNYGTYTGVATDTINGAATADAIFFVEYAALGRYTISYYVDGDTLTLCAGDVTIQPRGSYDGVTWTNIGSSVAWTASTAVYLANNSVNTYTEVNASHTQTIATATDYDSGFLDGVDSLGNSGVGDYYHDDTLTIAQRVNTVAAQTVTVTLPGVDYRYVQILFTGTTNTRVEIETVGLKVTPLVGKL